MPNDIVNELLRHVSPIALTAMTLTFPIVTVLVAYMKVPIDAKMDPHAPLHDWVLQTLTLVLDCGGVVLFMALLGGITHAVDVIWVILATIMAALLSDALYHRVRGATPVTPVLTPQLIEKVLSFIEQQPASNVVASSLAAIAQPPPDPDVHVAELNRS